MAGKSLFVRLKNVYSGEYLYAASDELARDGQRRSVFTWRNTNDSLGNWADWKMTGTFTEGTFRVRLASRTYQDEPLFVPLEPEYLYNDKRRNIYTWRTQSALPDESADWFMETDATQTAKHPNRYTLLNVLLKEYLYVGDEGFTKDASRRPVFTWIGAKKDFVDNKQHMWDVEIISENA